MAHVRKGDEVIVVTGKNRGEKGRVLVVDPVKQRVKVEKINMIKRHVRPSNKNPSGGIVERENFIHISNVRLWDPKAQAPCRTAIRMLEDGKKVRVSKKSGETF